MKIGIFGGTFDPLTLAHYAIVKEVLHNKLVDKVIIVPTTVTWHKDKKSTKWLNPIEKSYILNKFFGPDSELGDKVIVDCSEILNPNPNTDRRFIHQLSEITLKYGIQHDYYTIIGTDSFKMFPKWYAAKAILGLSNLIVISGRGGERAENFDAVDFAWGKFQIIYIMDTFSDISSTKIRKVYGKCEDGIEQYINDLKEDIKDAKF